MARVKPPTAGAMRVATDTPVELGRQPTAAERAEGVTVNLLSRNERVYNTANRATSTHAMNSVVLDTNVVLLAHRRLVQADITVPGFTDVTFTIHDDQEGRVMTGQASRFVAQAGLPLEAVKPEEEATSPTASLAAAPLSMALPD